MSNFYFSKGSSTVTKFFVFSSIVILSLFAGVDQFVSAGTGEESFSESTCNNVTNGGSIGNSQSGCAPFNPSAITNTASPSGGSGTIEYMWLYKNNSTGNNFWTVSGASSATYDPPSLTETTTYRRCARRNGCSSWDGETNDVVITVTNCNPTLPEALNCTGQWHWQPTLSLNGCDINAQVRFVDGGTFTINLPSELANNSVNLSNVRTSSFDGYCTRATVSQPNEQWKIVFFKNGSVVGQTGYTTDIADNVIQNTRFDNFGPFTFPNGIDQIKLVHYEDATLGNGSASTPNSVVPSGVCFTYTTNPICNNVTSGGSIGSNQTGCSPFDPANIVNMAWPTGGSGNIQYMWIYKAASTNNQWVEIAGANAASYNPGALTETTMFRRCARREGCTAWDGESNIVTVTVNNCCSNITNGGSIGYNQAGCAPYDPAPFVSITAPSGGSGTIQYVWLFKNASTNWQFQELPNSAGSTYDSGALTETTTFRRCSRRSGCSTFDGESNDVTVTVNGNCTAEEICELTGYNSQTGRIFYIPNYGTDFKSSPSNPLQIAKFSNGTAHIYGTIERISNANHKFVVSLWFEQKSTYAQWIAMGLQAHSPNLGDESTWTFYKWSTSLPNTLVGQGSLAGTTLNLTNQDPSYGLQLGNGANALNTNANGISNWFSYTGTTSGHGDLNGTFECAQPEICDLRGYDSPNGRVFWIPNYGTDFRSAASNPMKIAKYPNGTARIYGTIERISNPNQRFEVSLWFEQKSTYAQWTAMGLQAHSPELGNETTWTYYKWSTTLSNTLVGQGSLAGTTLYLTNQNPAYGLQLGDGANALNTNVNGISNWFSYTGTTSGHGDLNGTYVCVEPCAETCEIDNTPPTPDNLNPSITLNCGQQYPNVTFSDNCSDVTISYDEYDALKICELAFGPTYTNYNLWFHGTPAPYNKYHRWDDGKVVLFEDGTAKWVGRAVNLSDPNSGWIIEIFFEELVDWNTWSANGGYNPGDSQRFNRLFAEVDFDRPYTIQGYGAFLGSTIVLNPSGNTYGNVHFMDLGPRDVYGSYGAGFWISYSGNMGGLPVNGGNENMQHIDSYNALTNCETNPNCLAFDVREWMVSDNCGNPNVYWQVVKVLDTVAPVISNVPPNVTVECQNEIPASSTPTVSDNCDSDIQLIFSETLVGVESDTTVCHIADANAGHTLWLSGAVRNALGLSNSNFVTVGSGQFEKFSDGTIKFTGLIRSAQDPNKRFQYEANYRFKRSFEEWTSIPNPNSPTGFRQEKLDAGTTITIGDEYLDWEYYELDPTKPNTLTGVDDLSGISLNFSHAPADYKYGAQLGENASLQSYGLGFSAWITVSGDINGTHYSSAGDWNFSINNCEGQDDFECDDQYQIVRTWTAMDDCGNTATAQQTITVLGDTEAPTFDNLPANNTVACDVLPFPEDLNVTASDNCDPSVIVTITYEDQGEGCDRTRTFTFRAEDDCANVTMATRVFTTHDDVPPTFIMVPDNGTSLCGELPSPNNLMAAATDNCDGNVTITFSVNDQGLECNQVRTITWTATDDCGNQAMVSRTFSASDNIDPEFVNIPADMEMECGQVAPNVEVLATDNCDDDVFVDMESEIIPQDCGYLFVRTWTAIDDCGNTITDSQTITFVDNTNPEVDYAPENMTIECSSIVPFQEPTFSDICDEELDIDFSEVTEPNGCTSKITRRWIASDDCGNEVEVVQVITFIDTTDPVIINAPINITVTCETVPSVPTNVTAEDICDENVPVTFNETTTDLACGYQITRTWTAIDDCQNVATAAQIITVLDNIDPTLQNIPADVIVSCDAIPGVPTNITATDNCSDLGEIEFSEQIVNDPTGAVCAYSIVRTWTVEDECGNEAVRTQTIQVIDNTPPTILNAPANSSAECSQIPAAPQLFASDNCSDDLIPAVLTEMMNPVSACTYQLVRTWTATDICGNSSSVNQTITVTDTTAPTFDNAPANATVSCGSEIEVPVVTASDACDENVTVEFFEMQMGEGCQYVLNRVWVATDDCGNNTVHTQMLTVTDNVAPYIVNAPSTTITIGCEDAEPTDAPVFADACDENVSVSSNTTIANVTTCSYDKVKLWTAIDDCGNVATFTRTITVIDNTNPSLVGVPANTTVNCANIPPAPQVTATDVCSSATVTMNEVVGTGCPYIITRTWTATDLCGNSVSASQEITVVDADAPEFDFVPENITVECSNIPAGNINQVEVSDACSEDITVTVNDVTTSGFCIYYIFRTWTATDACGNSAQATQMLTVTDTTNPTLIGVPANVDAQCGEIPTVPNVTADDNCTPVEELEVMFSENEVALDCGYQIIRTWSVSDYCGNIATATQVITINDTEGPVASNVPGPATIVCGSALPTSAPTFEDECSEFEVSVNDVEVAFGCSYNVIRTWTAIDACGNETSVSQTISVVDTTSPSFTTTVPNATAECGSIPAPAVLTANDSCSEADVVYNGQTQINDTDGCGYILIRSWTAEDVCGNQAVFTQTITVIDTTAPVLVNVPANDTVECDAVPAPAQVTADDICFDGNMVVSLSADTVVIDNCSYQIIRTWSAEDNCGNEVSATQVITVIDSTNPTFDSLPEDMEVECDAIPAAAVLTASDNCDENVTVTVSELSGEGCEYTIVRTYTATDDCGNVATYVQTITVRDTEAPTLSGVPANTTLECNSQLPVAFVNASDNCDEVVPVSFSMITNFFECGYEVVRTWTATDDCGNTISRSQTITFEDTTAPFVLTAPDALIEIECGTPMPTQAPTFGDVCDDELQIVAISGIASVTDCSETIERVWTATDDCGNAVSFTQTIVITDTTAPEFTFVPEAITVECSEIPAPGTPVATDVCSSVTITLEETIVPVNDCIYELVRTWTATDVCGNASEAIQVIIVEDTTAPTLAGVPANVMQAACDNIPVVANVTATDLCDETPVVTFSQNEAGSCPTVITRTWVAADACGNESTATQLIYVYDNLAPELFGVPADTTIECSDEVENVVVTADDNCSEDLVVSLNAETTELECGSIMVRTWSVTDDCGNTTMATQTINIVDTTAPSIESTPVNGLTFECSDEIPMVEPTFSDLCDDEVTVEFTEEVTNVSACGYTIVRTWTATDDCDNPTVVTQNINVVDTTAPEFENVPVNETVLCDAIPAPVAPTAEDNCSGVDLTYNEVTSAGCPYTITRTWTATDECGNAASVSQILTVIDTENPVLVGVPENDTIECDQVIVTPVVTATDNCTELLNVQLDEQEVALDCGYAIVRTWYVTDNCGNMATASQTLTVTDTTAPELSGTDSETTLECNVMPSIIAPTATDNCDEDVTIIPSFVQIPGECENSYTQVFTWTAIDDCGNTSVRTFTFNFVDTTAPTFDQLVANQTVECDAVPAALELTATDNCDDNVEVTVSESQTPGCNYVITRVYTAVDNCGNENSVTETINVVDTTAPSLENVPANETLECTQPVPAAFVTATDNCDENPSVEMSSVTNEFECGFEVVRTWTATDNCGNVATATQTITFVDTTAPFINSQPENIEVECDEEVPFSEPSFGDACDEELDVDYNTFESDFNNCGYVINRIWTATDNCGNSTEVTQLITITDTTAPVIVGQIEVIGFCDQSYQALVTVSDNCDENPTLTWEDFLVSGGCQGRVLRTYTASDLCGNESTFVQIITLADDESPMVVEAPENVSIECTDEVPAAPVLEFTDNCDDELEVSFNEQTIPADCGFTIVRTWTATDNCENQTFIQQFINVADVTNPQLFNIPVSSTIECGNAIPGVPTNIFATDNCTENVDIVLEETENELSCGYEIVRIWRVYDDCGNGAMATQTITVVDTQAPAINGQVEDMTVSCDNIPAAPVFTAFDTCDGIINVVFNETTGEGCPYSITRTWTATDACGNIAELTQVISVIDEVNPSFNPFPVWLSVSCDEVENYTITASDNCDADVQVTVIEELVFSGGCYGNLQRTYKATDNCGNFVTAVQIIQIVDNVDPVIENVPSEMTIVCESEIPAVPADVFATDNCTADVEVIFTETQTNDFCPYDIIRTWTAIDYCGNETVATQIIHVTVEVEGFAVMQTYPNPATDRFTFEFSTPEEAQVIGGVYDITGREVISLMNGTADAGRLYKFSVDTQRLNTGTYTVRMIVDGEVMTNRMVVTGR